MHQQPATGRQHSVHGLQQRGLLPSRGSHAYWQPIRTMCGSVQALCMLCALHRSVQPLSCAHPSRPSPQEHGTILPMLIAAKTAQPAALTPLAIILEGLEQLEKLTAANLKAGVFQGV